MMVKRVRLTLLFSLSSSFGSNSSVISAFKLVARPRYFPCVSNRGVSLSTSTLVNGHVHSQWHVRPSVGAVSPSALFGKKKKGGGGGGRKDNPYKKPSNRQPPKQEKQSVQDQRFDAATRQFMYTIVNLSKALPDKSKTILKNINLCFYPGAKIGVVGMNGSGKSTLLKIMAGLDMEFDGTARPLPGASIGYLAQEPKLEYSTVQECIDDAIQSSKRLLDEYNTLGLKLADPSMTDDEISSAMSRLQALSDEIDAKNLWELDRTVERAMDSLRVPTGDARIEVLSGGEKRRVALCNLLLGSHDMLLLDEPTNALDAESVAWLEKFLSDYKGTVVCITHDRYFLEDVCQWVLELDRGEGIPYEGNYSSWLEAKKKRVEGEKKADSAAAKAVSAELEWVRSNAKAKTTKSKARLKRYDELLLTSAPKEIRNEGQIYIPPGPRLGDVVIDVTNVRKSFGDRLLIDGLDFSLPQAGIVGIIGPNGAGKSTLVKMLLGMDSPDSGLITIGQTVKMVGVGQERMKELNSDSTAFEEITGGVDEIELGSQKVASRAYVSWFGFKGAQQQALVRNLSGGERNRVQLAKLLKLGANVVILDEPTNDLDVETLRSLEEGLLNFAGCAIVVSHDRYFLDRIATHILAFEGGSKCFFYPGNYAEYEENRIQRVGGEGSIKRIKYAPLINV